MQRGSLLQARWSAYPRLVRLAHQADAALDGRVIASVTEREDGVFQVGFHASADDGATFERMGTLHDPGFATGLCCGTLFELPQRVGTLAAGTLLYAASVGADLSGTLMEQRIYRSDDAGVSFTRMNASFCGRSTVARGSGPSGVWEPEFLVTSDGSLACIYSDETEPGKSQVLKLTRTRDGTTWSEPTVIVSGARAGDRPGMAVVRRLPSGQFAMSFESCSASVLDCSVRLKLSADGIYWGPPGSLGARPQTASGQYFRHAPTLAWAGGIGSRDGMLALIGQVVGSDADGGIASADSGRVLLVNASGDGNGDWRMVAAPIGLPNAPAHSGWCANYSTPLLLSANGSRVLLMQTDSTPDGGCNARFGSGDISP